jgi:hypothetical protein
MEHDGCVGCKYENEDANSKHCLGCKQNATDKYTPMTNADKIRNMSDEELAELLANQVLNALHFYCGTETFEKIDFKKSIEVDMKLDWLRSDTVKEF